MKSTLEHLTNINKETIDLLKGAGIDTIEKLASRKVGDLTKIKGITILTAVNYIQEAIEFLNNKEVEAIEKTANISKVSENVLKSRSEISQRKEGLKEDKLKEESHKEKLKKQTVSKKGAHKKKPLKKDKVTPKKKDEIDIGYLKDIFS